MDASEFYIVIPYDSRDQFGYLHEADVFADAGAGAGAELFVYQNQSFISRPSPAISCLWWREMREVWYRQRCSIDKEVM